MLQSSASRPEAFSQHYNAGRASHPQPNEVRGGRSMRLAIMSPRGHWQQRQQAYLRIEQVRVPLQPVGIYEVSPSLAILSLHLTIWRSDATSI